MGPGLIIVNELQGCRMPNSAVCPLFILHCTRVARLQSRAVLPAASETSARLNIHPKLPVESSQ